MPADRRTRVLRRLQVAHDELSHNRALTKSAVKGYSPSEVASILRKEAINQERQNGYLRAVAKANGIDRVEYENSLPAWHVIVCEAGKAMDLPNDALLVVWRFASGLTLKRPRFDAASF